MKRIFFSLAISSFSIAVFGQSVTISPTNDEHIITNYGTGSFPNIVGRSAGGTAASPTATPANNALLTLGGRGHIGGLNFNPLSSASIGFYANQQFANKANGTYIRFVTTPDNSGTTQERMRIAHDGNVGIGTISSPAKLTIAGDMALQKIQRETSSGGFNDYDRQNASIAIFENGGTLGGIAGGSEGQMLYVVSGYGNAQSALVIRHDSPSNPTAANRILTHTGADFTISSGLGGVLLIYDATKARWRIVETPSNSGTAGWGLTGNGGTNPATQFIGTTDAQPLAFKTNNVERMRILSGGNVGIGTNAPDRKLHVYNGNSGRTPNLNSSLFVEKDGNNYLEIASPDNGERGVMFSNPTDGASGGIYYSNKDMYFNTNSNDRRMTILANGNVGIGTITPTAKLDIEGDIVVRKTTISTTGVQNALNRGGGSSIYFGVSGTVTLNGIAGGQDGMILYLFTASAATLIINNENVGAIAANRIATHTGSALTITGRGGATLIYDSSVGLWRVIGVAN